MKDVMNHFLKLSSQGGYKITDIFVKYIKKYEFVWQKKY